MHCSNIHCDINDLRWHARNEGWWGYFNETSDDLKSCQRKCHLDPGCEGIIYPAIFSSLNNSEIQRNNQCLWLKMHACSEILINDGNTTTCWKYHPGKIQIRVISQV